MHGRAQAVPNDGAGLDYGEKKKRADLAITTEVVLLYVLPVVLRLCRGRLSVVIVKNGLCSELGRVEQQL